MKSQGMNSAAQSNWAASLRWFGLGFAFVLGIAVITLIVMLLTSGGEQAGGIETADQEIGRALSLQRFGEWSRYEAPRTVQPAGWAAYRAGERAPDGGVSSGALAGWAAYRAGERADYRSTWPAAPAGWAAYRAGERAPGQTGGE